MESALPRGVTAMRAGAAWLPALGWMRHYDRRALVRDAAAGVTLAAYLLPASLGDASLANLPPETGVYACVSAGLVFWLFCSSRHTVITVTSAISLLIGSTLGGLADGNAARFAGLASGTALLVAAIAGLAWLIRAGAIVSFISESVMVGFKCGVALYLASTQLPKLLGIPGAHGDFWKNSAALLRRLSEANPYAVGCGVAALALLVLGKRILPHKPVALFVVVGAILVSSATSLETRGVQLLGEVPAGLPAPGLPALRWSDVNALLPLAIACFLLGAVETAAIGRTFAAKHGGRLDATQEFLALSGANLAAGLLRGFPVSGGLSQSLVNEGSGARTPFSGAIAAVLLAGVALWFTHLLRSLPQPVLAAIVLVAVAGLFQASALRQLWRGDRREFVVALVALFGVLGSGLLHGVLIGAVISMVQILRRAARPHVALLGRVPGTQRYTDRDRHLDNELIPGVMVFRPESGLLYFNIEHVTDRILDRVRSGPELPKLVVLDLSASPFVDLQSAHALGGLSDRLAADGVRLRVVEARAPVRERLRREGLEGRLGGADRLGSVADAVDTFVKAGPERPPGGMNP